MVASLTPLSCFHSIKFVFFRSFCSWYFNFRICDMVPWVFEKKTKKKGNAKIGPIIVFLLVCYEGAGSAVIPNGWASRKLITKKIRRWKMWKRMYSILSIQRRKDIQIHFHQITMQFYHFFLASLGFAGVFVPIDYITNSALFRRGCRYFFCADLSLVWSSMRSTMSRYLYH